MATISENVTHAAYSWGKKITDGNIGRTAATTKLVEETGCNDTSAKHYIRAFLQMMKGAQYSRTINLYSTEYFLKKIHEDFGSDALERALNAVKAHIEYHRDVTGINLAALRRLHDVFIRELEMQDTAGISRGSHAFNASHLVYFEAVEGAYSLVTASEASKDQITIAGAEKDIFEAHFGTTLHTGVMGDNPTQATKSFNWHHSDGSIGEIALTVLRRPRGDRNEVQFYTSGSFKPRANDIWFVYRKEGEQNLYIGYMSSADWRGLNFDASAMIAEEIDDEAYQIAVNTPSAVKAKRIAAIMRTPRNLQIAQRALVAAKYACEVDGAHKTFLNRVGQRPYVEAHHLIPLAAQAGFGHSLDVEANIIAICPNCHRLLHHSEMNLEYQGILERLWESRQDALSSVGLDVTLEKLIDYYK